MIDIYSHLFISLVNHYLVFTSLFTLWLISLMSHIIEFSWVKKFDIYKVKIMKMVLRLPTRFKSSFMQEVSVQVQISNFSSVWNGGEQLHFSMIFSYVASNKQLSIPYLKKCITLNQLLLHRFIKLLLIFKSYFFDKPYTTCSHIPLVKILGIYLPLYNNPYLLE